MQIYINKNGQQSGPFEESKVLEMLRNGQVSPSDLGFKQGQSQWQKLETMFPTQPVWNPPNLSANQPQFQQINPQSQPIPQKSGGSKGMLFGLIGCGGLLILGIIGLVGLFAISGKKTLPVVANANSANTNSVNSSPKPTPVPTIDNGKYQEMLNKKDELFKLSPPAKLQTTPTIKSMVLVIEKLGAEKDAASEILSQYSNDKYGIKSEQVAKNLDELQTLIQIKCSQGKEIGKYGPRMSYLVAYSSVCNVSIIDYKTKQTIGKKTFVNAKRPKTIPDNGYDFINDSPTDEIEKYLTGLAKE